MTPARAQSTCAHAASPIAAQPFAQMPHPARLPAASQQHSKTVPEKDSRFVELAVGPRSHSALSDATAGAGKSLSQAGSAAELSASPAPQPECLPRAALRTLPTTGTPL